MAAGIEAARMAPRAHALLQPVVLLQAAQVGAQAGQAAGVGAGGRHLHFQFYRQPREVSVSCRRTIP
jgi:hypothetical protein